MNSKMTEMHAADMLARFVKGKHPYIAPQCEVIEVEEMRLICTSPTVTPSAPGFNEDGWDNETSIDDGGEHEFE